MSNCTEMTSLNIQRSFISNWDSKTIICFHPAFMWEGKWRNRIVFMFTSESGILYDSPWSFERCQWRCGPLKLITLASCDKEMRMSEAFRALLISLFIKEQPLSSSLGKLTSMVKKKKKSGGTGEVKSKHQHNVWIPTIRLKILLLAIFI